MTIRKNTERQECHSEIIEVTQLKRTVNILILATRLVIASTGAMLIVGHEAPCRISALACRIESLDHPGNEGNSRQVSGTSDASKTQLGLIGS